MKTKYISPELCVVLIAARHMLTTSSPDVPEPEEDDYDENKEVICNPQIFTNDAF